jgi:hypothetical protein
VGLREPEPGDDLGSDADDGVADAVDPPVPPRAGFESRTYRRCHRLLMFHTFTEEPEVARNLLVRSTDLRYADPDQPSEPRKPIYRPRPKS